MATQMNVSQHLQRRQLSQLNVIDFPTCLKGHYAQLNSLINIGKISLLNKYLNMYNATWINAPFFLTNITKHVVKSMTKIHWVTSLCNFVWLCTVRYSIRQPVFFWILKPMKNIILKIYYMRGIMSINYNICLPMCTHIKYIFNDSYQISFLSNLFFKGKCIMKVVISNWSKKLCICLIGIIHVQILFVSCKMPLELI